MADNNGMETCDYVANSSVIADSKKVCELANRKPLFLRVCYLSIFSPTKLYIPSLIPAIVSDIFHKKVIK